MGNTPKNGQLGASCRVAFAALTHDLGKFAERAAPAVDGDRLKTHVTNYCRWHERGKYLLTIKNDEQKKEVFLRIC